MRDLAEEDLLVRPQVRRGSLADEGFPVEERHLGSASLWREKKGGKESHSDRTGRGEANQQGREDWGLEPGGAGTSGGGAGGAWSAGRSGSFVTAVNLPTWSRRQPPRLPLLPLLPLPVLLPPPAGQTAKGAAPDLLTQLWDRWRGFIGDLKSEKDVPG